jgi:hypothetical protein
MINIKLKKYKFKVNKKPIKMTFKKIVYVEIDEKLKKKLNPR